MPLPPVSGSEGSAALGWGRWPASPAANGRSYNCRSDVLLPRKMRPRLEFSAHRNVAGRVLFRSLPPGFRRVFGWQHFREPDSGSLVPAR